MSSNNYPAFVRKLETHSIDGGVLDAVKLALVQTLGRNSFRQDCGILFLTTRTIDIVYRQISEDIREAEVRYYGFRCVVTIDGLSHHMTRITSVEVLEHSRWIPQKNTVQLMLKSSTNLLNFVDSWENDRITLLLGRFLSESQVLTAKKNMCPLPMFEVTDFRPDENDQQIKVTYMFEDANVDTLEITWMCSDQGLAIPVDAVVRLHNGEHKVEL
jgi:hypothetical protein